MPFKTLRACLLYGSAWIPYTASYYLIFRLQNSANKYALADAIINVFPAAVLGVAVLGLAQRLKWPASSPLRFFSLHGLGAITYTALWWVTVELLSAAFDFLDIHRWRLLPWGMYAAQWQAFSGLMIYGNLVGFAYLIQAQQRGAEEERRRMLAEALRVQSELDALRSRSIHTFFSIL